MNKEEKEICIGKRSGKTYNKIKEMAKEIVRLQKENEELKEQRDNAIKLRNELIEEQKITCISKNKIRDKIKELEEIKNKGDMAQYIAVTEKIKILNELLGE